MKPQYFFFSVVFLFAMVDVVVLWRVWVLLRGRERAVYLRWIFAGWSFVSIVFCTAWLIRNGKLGGTRDPMPRMLVGAEYIWHFLFVPFVVLGLVIDGLVRVWRRIKGRIWGKKRAEEARVERKIEATVSPVVAKYSRRRFLASAGIAAVPVALAGMAGAGVAQIGKFRLRFYDLAVPGWPGGLDGYSITVIADVHVGVFSTPQMLDDIVEASNRLKSDLVLLPGDLINISHDDLHPALDMVVRLDSRDGVYMIQGNHDVAEGADGFDNTVRHKGVNLLVDERATIRTRGERFQILGTRWLETEEGRDESVAFTAGLRDPDVFAFMMAHHPHSWDTAASSGIPLVISGHTHGGQIMLTRQVGLGRLRFRYLSGRYTKPGSQLIVSNGVGNWFPLRVGAPAEILQITLHPQG